MTERPAGRKPLLTSDALYRIVNNARGYGSPAAHHYGSSPQHMHHFGGPQHRAGSNNYGNKNYNAHGQQHQMNQNNHTAPSGPQARAPDGPEEAK